MARAYVATFVVMIACILAISLRNVDENGSERMPYIIQMNKSAKPAKFPSLEDWYASILKRFSPSGEMLYTYGTVLDGFAATLSSKEAEAMMKEPGCLAVIASSLHQLHTTRSPEFLGLAGPSGVWSKYSTEGEDIIIGVIDSGIWPESKSFGDEGIHGIPEGWKGTCEAGEDSSFPKCNNKIIGARYYRKGFEKHYKTSIDLTKEFTSPRDSNGHGTHVASIAAGAEVKEKDVNGVYASGTARGMAPKARLAIYKACWNDHCALIHQVKAIDDAVADGVHIISISIRSADVPFYQDDGIVAIAEYGAMKKGVLVSASAGNYGPDQYTVRNTAPWIMTVGASSIDRDFPASVELGNGKNFEGTSTYRGKKLSVDAPLVYASANERSQRCLKNSLDPKVVKGKIVVCDLFGMNVANAEEKGNEVETAGGVGIIVTNAEQKGAEQVITNLNIPSPNHVLSISVSYEVGKSIKSYINGKVEKAKATIQIKGETRVGRIIRAPLVAAFSSRGPSKAYPYVLKPDLISPGLNILGALENGYEFNSGTSMACPHVSGVAALIKSKHRDWSPAAIKSALMTSSRWDDNRGQPIEDSYNSKGANFFATGAGHIHSAAAMDPELVYDMTSQDYANFFCSLSDIREHVARLNEHCPDSSSDPTDLNYPSFYVSFEEGKENVQKKSKTVTYVGTHSDVEYSCSVLGKVDGVDISVNPKQLKFTRPGEKVTYTVTFENKKKPRPGPVMYRIGEIMCECTKGGNQIVRTPVVVKW